MVATTVKAVYQCRGECFGCEHRLRVFESRVLGRIFGPKGVEVIGSWDLVKEDEMDRAWSTHGAKKTAYRVLVRKPEGKRPLGRPRRSWEDIIKKDLREIGWGGMDWIELAQGRDLWRAHVNTVINLRVP
jgi:hypothetical protein